ncbi:MAG: MBL fold metallo-hydrolase [Anaerolineales bacterium]|nr:MBL fold metallo-hydrolase [Anaerolineales bacterium]
MQIEPGLFLIGSGSVGFDLTDPYDCNMYLFDSGNGFLLFDAGAGIDINRILRVLNQDGLEVDDIRHLFLTHGHADHSGGSKILSELTPLTTYASSGTAAAVRDGAEKISLPDAIRAGVYPANYVYRNYDVDHTVDHGEKVEIGRLVIEAIATPGHSYDHTCFLVSGFEKRYLISGDAVFYGGKIILQDSYDCNVPETIDSIRKLAALSFEALLPGHLCFSLNDGKRHIEDACAVIDQLRCPESIV